MNLSDLFTTGDKNNFPTVVCKSWIDSSHTYGFIRDIHKNGDMAIAQIFDFRTMPIFDFEVINQAVSINPPYYYFSEIPNIIHEHITDDNNYNFNNDDFRIYKIHKYPPERSKQYYCGMGQVEYHLTVISNEYNMPRIFCVLITRYPDGKLYYAIPG